MVTKTLLETFVTGLNEKFGIERESALQITDHDIFTTPELLKFSGFDSDETLDEILSKGVVFLRPGFYKIIEPPFYKTNQDYPTFAAKVLYFHEPSDRVIEFTANLGPMTNIHAKYLPLSDSKIQDQLFHKFLEDRNADDPEKYYYQSKKKFYEDIFSNSKIFE